MTYRFDPVDLEQVCLLARLSPGGRIRAMLDARELAVAHDVAETSEVWETSEVLGNRRLP